MQAVSLPHLRALVSNRVLSGTAVLVLVFVAAWGTSACQTSTPPTAADAGANAGEPDAELSPITDAGADAATCVVPGTFGSRKCTECAAESCCAELTECEADPGCHSLIRCILPCDDQAPDAGACARDCIARYPDAESKWRTFESCVSFDEPCRFHCSIPY